MWTDVWIGLPYAELGRGPREFDCLGLFLALQGDRHGRTLFDPRCTMGLAARRDIVESQRSGWRPVEIASEGDALVFRVRGHLLHIGYAVNKRLMLHTSQETGESVLEDFLSIAWGGRLEGIYRYVE